MYTISTYKPLTKLTWPDDLECGSKKNWKKKMLDPNEWGNKIVLSLAANLLEIDVVIIPAFRESSFDQVSGITTIKPLNSAKHKIHLFAFKDLDFISPHYQSVRPRTRSPFSLLHLSMNGMRGVRCVHPSSIL